MIDISSQELDILYKQWLDSNHMPKIYCSQYPDFLAKEFPEGIRTVNDQTTA